MLGQSDGILMVAMFIKKYLQALFEAAPKALYNGRKLVVGSDGAIYLVCRHMLFACWLPDRIFQKIRASRSGDRRFLLGVRRILKLQSCGRVCLFFKHPMEEYKCCLWTQKCAE